MNFMALAEANYSKIYYHSLKHVKNNHDAADITQNTFIKALKHFDRVRDVSSYEPWLFVICNNEIKQHYRNAKKAAMHEYSEVKSPGFPETQGDESYMDKDLLYSAIDGLSNIQRQVVLLKYFGGYTMKELAMVLQISQATVKSRLYEARQTLKKLLDSPVMAIPPALQKERRNALMATLNLCAIGAETITCMSLHAQKQLLSCAKDNAKFNAVVLAELANIPTGEAFMEACGGRLSYDEFLRILSCCDDAIMYRIGGSDYKTWRNATNNPLAKDMAALYKTGGYIDSIEPIVYVKSIPETMAWYKKYLNWNSDNTDEESEMYGHACIFPGVLEDDNTYRYFKGFHLRCGACPGDPQAIIGPIPNCSFFVFVSGLEDVRASIIDRGWGQVSEIRDYSWGVKSFAITDINGLVLEFCEWQSDS